MHVCVSNIQYYLPCLDCRSNHLAQFYHKSSVEGKNIVLRFHCSGFTGAS